jgi:hypothetical protein
MFITTKIALESSMACRVFRGIKLGTIEDVGGDTSKASTLHFRLRPRGSRSAATALTCSSAPEVLRGIKSPHDGSNVIDITKAMESGESNSNSECKHESLQEHDNGRSVGVDNVDVSQVVVDRV